jgi:tetratricopeptide (TPR) repeat protein
MRMSHRFARRGDGSVRDESRVSKSMKLKVSILILFAGLCSGAARGQESEYATGRGYYTEGQFKKAAAHFQLALKANPDSAESYYWMGMSYEMLGDIAAPFGGKDNRKARVYLTKATELAPMRPEYRRELFNFLLDSNASSRATLRQAAGILRTLPESDPEYTLMRWELERESRANVSVEARLGCLFLAAPQAAWRIAALPASVWSKRSERERLEARR